MCPLLPPSESITGMMSQCTGIRSCCCDQGPGLSLSLATCLECGGILLREMFSVPIC